MCGLAGILRFDDQPVATDRLQAMLEQLRHRGPDGEGIARHGPCTLVHARLSIIDPLGGDQPMTLARHEEHGELALVFNGEIYNHRSLRQQLESLGHQFVSDHSDTEVLLLGYRQWGTDLPQRLEGMFAFAIWDSTQRQLFLCRDRIGKKPLYFRWSRDRSELTFASLVATLVTGTYGEQHHINRHALIQFLQFGYTDHLSLIENVEEVLPSHWMLIYPEGRVEVQRYWMPPADSSTSAPHDAVQAVHDVIDQAVTKRLEADAPLGCFLSGGIDSSIIAALAQRSLAARGGDALKTFSVTMPEIDYDESPYAHEVARHIGSDHRSLAAQADADIMGDLEHLIALSGEPTADSSLLPTYWLSQTTREFVKVALSGDGGDELFGGYDRYRALRLLRHNRWWLSKIPRGLLDHHNPRTRRARMSRLVYAAGESASEQQYQRMIEIFSEQQIRELAADTPLPLHDWPDQPIPSRAAMCWDLTHYLPYDLLRKLDRASMAVALEVRCPMLDTQVCDLSNSLTAPVLMPHGLPKGLLRDVARMLELPSRIVRRPKRGFAVPIGRWFYGPLREALRDRIFDSTLDSLDLNRRFIETIFTEHDQRQRDHTHRLFGLLTLSIWARWLKKVAS